MMSCSTSDLTVIPNLRLRRPARHPVRGRQLSRTPSTRGPRISYSLPRAGHLKLSIYNVRGQLVKTLIDGHRPAGANQTIVWDGTDNLGSAAASGVYFYEARALGDVRIGKATLLK